MGLALLVLFIAVIAGRLAGGRIAGLAHLPIKGLGILVGALAAQLAGTLLAGVAQPLYPLGLGLSAALTGWFAIRNRRLAGIPLAGLGLVLNALVVVLNGEMPVSEHAAARAGLMSRLDLAGDPRHETIGPDTRLGFLGQVIPVPIPVHREVDSVGDVLLAAGIGLLVFTGMVVQPPSPSTSRWDKVPDTGVVGADEMP
ncbi:hypothetical protein LI90_1015 [Carbonactinospora thermoautotrophica]|uniref:DUF5317 domain-containing protein n=1 Tax=Carbonactinospora thermoautotrophica TaxID=1469144 RepID=A0A132MNE1_9ACTN|nr:DUF5317 family protein [Carbonactinospora thermoautotrophica]KWW99380.1 hypothetical protein LI90_1015 [Carbonactinospora thermoautotrophica]